MSPDGDTPTLGDLLRLLHDAPDRVARLRAEITRTSDPAVAALAFERMAEGGTGAVFYAYPDEEVDGGSEAPEDDVDDDVQRTRTWVDLDTRREREEQGGAHASLAVRRGETWWRWDEYSGAMSNEDEEVGTSIADDRRWIAGGLAAVAALRLELLGESTVGGRATLRCRAVPREKPEEDHDWSLFTLPAHGATGYEIDVDAELGLILRVLGFLEERELLVTEVVDLGVDEDFADDLFTFASPDGSEVRRTSETFGRHHEHLTPDALAARADFALFAPRRIPAGWEATLGFTEAVARPPSRASAYVRLTAADGLRSVTIQQVEVDVRGEYEEWDHADPAPWSEIVADGVRFEYRDPAADWQPARVRFDRDGTRVFLDSTSLSASALLELAVAMVPLDPAAPDFTGE